MNQNLSQNICTTRIISRLFYTKLILKLAASGIDCGASNMIGWGEGSTSDTYVSPGYRYIS